MTPKEVFERVWEDCSKLDLPYVSKHNLMDDLRTIKQALTELEELKRDVKRFIDLYHAFEEHGLCGDEADEFLKLEVKLSKVGKEDV